MAAGEALRDLKTDPLVVLDVGLVECRDGRAQPHGRVRLACEIHELGRPPEQPLDQDAGCANA